ncbi:MAG TPA: hypothetical protein VK473_14000 [Terriglobales bacterium]|nr:hypothetical protein [Terriglobales bacterium]
MKADIGIPYVEMGPWKCRCGRVLLLRVRRSEGEAQESSGSVACQCGEATALIGPLIGLYTPIGVDWQQIA